MIYATIKYFPIILELFSIGMVYATTKYFQEILELFPIGFDNQRRIPDTINIRQHYYFKGKRDMTTFFIVALVAICYEAALGNADW